jgi:hypothetical protein
VAAQVLSQSAEKSLVAFLTKADHAIHHKLSAAQIALGRELRAARARKAVVAGKGPAAHQARHKHASAKVRRGRGWVHDTAARSQGGKLSLAAIVAGVPG